MDEELNSEVGEEKSQEESKELSVAVPEEKKKPQNTIDNYNETLSDIDESEIQQFILTPEESALKSMLWHHIHRDWIEEQNMKKGRKRVYINDIIRT